MIKKERLNHNLKGFSPHIKMLSILRVYVSILLCVGNPPTQGKMLEIFWDYMSILRSVDFCSSGEPIFPLKLFDKI